MKKLWLFVVVLALALSSCGYKVFSPSFSCNEIFVPVWKNYSSAPELGELLSEALRKKLSQGRLFVPVFSKDSACFELKGRVKSVYLEPVGYLNYQQVSEVRINFVGEYELINLKTGDVLLKETISRYKVYDIPLSSPEETELVKTQALKKLAEEVAEKVLQRIVTRF